ncbi:substrate-binding periplasmic protein [Pseudomonas boanensis]|uniref:substrate-binding periplasmic protein n=1 Tax=Metapseudomonas boanensis TaxID=2822138 RepID=UPI0035D3EACD
MRSFLLLCLLLPTFVNAESLTVYYIEKPPYYHTERGEPTGFLLERARAIFSKADVPVHFEARPAKRILHELQQGRDAACSIGWFKTPERQQFAWFSRPIHRDAPMLVLTRNSLAEQIRSYSSLSALVQSPLRLGLVDGFSYGGLDHMLKTASSHKVTAPPAQTVRMLAAERIDFTLIDERELPYILAEADLRDAKLTKLNMPDIPAGQLRYLMCSKAVDDALRERLDQAIEDLGVSP